jgi:hypothetical protein
MLRFKSQAEQTAWSLAEALTEKGFATMRQAEEAAEMFRSGQLQTRQQFEQKGLGHADADIRWSGTANAKKALADNTYYMTQASMYHGAAAAQYARALYLSQTDG